MVEIWFRSNGDYDSRFLSNFFPCNVAGARSAEHRYQALKSADVREREYILSAPSALEAMRRGRSVTIRAGRNAEADMRIVLAEKFSNATLRSLLLGTGNATLIEDNRGPWGGRDGGANRLGVLLMELRESLRKGN